MDINEHLERLLNMYKAAPCYEMFRSKMKLSKGVAEIELEIKREYLQSAGYLTGPVFFKLLDESAGFAAYTLEPDFFLVTSSFTTYITKPVTGGVLKSVGKVVNANKNQYLCESTVYNDAGSEVARGSGIFAKSTMRFTEAMGYET